MILIRPDQTAKHAISIFEFRSGIEPTWSSFKPHLIKCSKQLIVWTQKNRILIFKFEFWNAHTLLFLRWDSLAYCATIQMEIKMGFRFVLDLNVLMLCIKHINLYSTLHHKSFHPVNDLKMFLRSLSWSSHNSVIHRHQCQYPNSNRLLRPSTVQLHSHFCFKKTQLVC